MSEQEPGGAKAPGRDDELVPADDRIIGVALRWSLLVAALVGAGILAAFLLRGGEEAEPEVLVRAPVEAPAPLRAAPVALPRLRFRDVTREAGIDFVHENGATGEKLLPETMGGGVAFLDFDGDGDQDLLFVNSERWPHDPRPGPRPTMALYRNDGSGRFENVTRAAGLDLGFYGMGVAAADHDGDGDVDLYLSAYGPNRLLRNDGGRFVDVTAEAGVAGAPSEWSTSCGFFDHDGDGDLDLFVSNYVAWSREADLAQNFTLNGVDRAYGPPVSYPGSTCRLFRNEGGGRFSDVSEEAGIDVRNPATGQPMAKALALTFVDVGDDGRLDVFVSNDTVQNFLFRNLGEGRFEEVGAVTGFGFDNSGAATGAMGIDAAALESDGLLSVGIGNFANESSSLYRQGRRPWQFADVAGAMGVGSASRLRLSFGLFFFDPDLDGRLDLLQANGHLDDEIHEVQPSQEYRQAAQLFWNRGRSDRADFSALPAEALGDLARPMVGRGAAFADIDADGDLDVVLTQAGGAPALLLNEQDTGHHWLRVSLSGRPPNRDAIGAWLELEASSGRQRRQVMPTRSYLSQVELPVTFGLGPDDQVTGLRVTWPDGTRQEVAVPGVDRILVVSQP